MAFLLWRMRLGRKVVGVFVVMKIKGAQNKTKTIKKARKVFRKPNKKKKKNNGKLTGIKRKLSLRKDTKELNRRKEVLTKYPSNDRSKIREDLE